MKESMLWITTLLLTAFAVSAAEGAVLGGDAAFSCDYQIFSRSDRQNGSFGDLFEISGINTVSPSTYLSLRGPGFPDEGTPLTDPTEPGGANIVAVRADGTWNFSWDSATLFNQRYWYSTGIYQIVASADATHQIIHNVDLERTYLAGLLNRSVIAEGETLFLSGWAYPLQTPQNLYVWVFGPTYASYGTVVTLDQDGYYSFVLPTRRIAHLGTGEYQLLVQHPMRDRQQDAFVKSGTVVHLPGDEGLPEGQDVDLAQLAPEDAVKMLTTSLRSEYCDRDDPCDDTYISLRFSIVARDSPALRRGDILAFVAPPLTTETTATTTAISTDTATPTTTATTAAPTTAPPQSTSPANASGTGGAVSIVAAAILLLAMGRGLRRR